MAKIALVRIDNRLIHGQVVTGYIGKLGVNKIIVVDDKTASNEFAKDVLALAVPPGAVHEVLSAADAAARWQEDGFGAGSVMIIFKSVPTARDAYEKGLHFESLMVGCTKTGSDRTKIEGAISLNKEEAAMLDELETSGVDVVFQQTAQTVLSSWKDVKRNHHF